MEPHPKDPLGSSAADPELKVVAQPDSESENPNHYVVLTGNPNAGKTTVFNALTGLRARVGNYPGVTVERKEGPLQGADKQITILDLPGAYSLNPQSLDEQVARDVLLNRLPDLSSPSLVVVVVDASNLQRNLYFATQVIELGYPTLIALNMIDVAKQHGQIISPARLAEVLGVPVVPLIASTGEGIPELRDAIVETLGATKSPPKPQAFLDLPSFIATEAGAIAQLLENGCQSGEHCTQAEALLLLGEGKSLEQNAYYPQALHDAVLQARKRLESVDPDWRRTAVKARYRRIAEIEHAVTTTSSLSHESFSDRVDRIVTHKFWGMLLFVAVMATMFLSIFVLAEFPMGLLQSGVGFLGDTIQKSMPPGDLRDLLVKGVIEGVGAVVVFLPQICLLFLFIGLLEDSGYMARAAFLMDRLMSKVGLHGKSFIPMLSSFACAIPGILATRTIEKSKDRLVTILVAPLIGCSARLPVYVLLLGACFPERGTVAGLTMLGMYLLGIVVAFGMAWIFKKTLLKGEPPMLVMELPPYKRPLPRLLLHHMWDRSRAFLYRAGTVILGINILLWFFVTYPKPASLPSPQTATAVATAGQKTPPALQTQADSGEKLRQSFAGMAGRVLEPIIAPIGFDWKIGIGLVTSFAAREVFVSTMAVVYNVEAGSDDDGQNRELARVMREQKRPDGRPVYTTATFISLMVFYVLAMQCVSTMVVVWRETHTWKWAALQWLYMTGLAWFACFLIYQGSRLLGFQ